ncbi:MAG: hypothetical protein WA421_01785 [Nitrososphaeraceae archaeon]
MLGPTEDSFAYAPASGYSGPDGLTVQATDSHGTASNIATVSISVTPSTSGAGGNNNTGQGVDKFGIKEIYPTKSITINVPPHQV